MSDDAVRVASLLVRAARSSDDSALWGEHDYLIQAKHLDALLARLSAAETERDQAHKRAEVFRHSLEITALDCGAAEARAEALSRALGTLAAWAEERYREGDAGYQVSIIARAALAGREGTGGG